MSARRRNAEWMPRTASGFTVKRVMPRRVATHHTATHLLHAVLRRQADCAQSLQEGSRIDADGLSFDFYAGFLSDRLRADTAGFLKEVEKEVNALARSGIIDKHG